MSNALGIGPQVMINRIVDRTGTPGDAQLAKVAELSMALEIARNDAEAASALHSPTGEGEAPIVSSGAIVDLLI